MAVSSVSIKNFHFPAGDLRPSIVIEPPSAPISKITWSLVSLTIRKIPPCPILSDPLEALLFASPQFSIVKSLFWLATRQVLEVLHQFPTQKDDATAPWAVWHQPSIDAAIHGVRGDPQGWSGSINAHNLASTARPRASRGTRSTPFAAFAFRTFLPAQCMPESRLYDGVQIKLLWAFTIILHPSLQYPEDTIDQRGS